MEQADGDVAVADRVCTDTMIRFLDKTGRTELLRVFRLGFLEPRARRLVVAAMQIYREDRKKRRFCEVSKILDDAESAQNSQ